MLEEERRQRGLEQRGEHVAVAREPLELVRRRSSLAALGEPLPEVELPRTTAQLARETTCERIFAIRPSEKSG